MGLPIRGLAANLVPRGMRPYLQRRMPVDAVAFETHAIAVAGAISQNEYELRVRTESNDAHS